MKQIILTLITTLLAPIFATALTALQTNEVKLVETNFPKSLSALKSESTGAKLVLENGLGYSYENADLDGTGKKEYLVVLYVATLSTTNVACELSVLKVSGTSGQLMSPTVLTSKDALNGCSSIQFRDLDGDGKNEVVISSVDTSGNDRQPYIFKWDTKKLNDITPIKKLGQFNVNAFRNISITNIKVGKSTLMVDSPIPDDEDARTVTYQILNGKITATGAFDFFGFAYKRPNATVETAVYKPTFTTDATYTLEIKNDSSHNRAVRTEVTVNGSIVLKPQDFCKAPPPKTPDNGTDDADDKNEDKLKRCVQKSGVYAIVNLKKTNEIKVKVYGRGDSIIQMTLNKK